MDAIVQLDGELRVARMNPAAERTFELPAERRGGLPRSPRLLAPRTRARWARSRASSAGARQRCAAPGSRAGSQARPRPARPFRAEATLSLFELHGRQHVTLILRNVNERLEAERRIRSLDRRDRVPARRSCASSGAPARSSAAAQRLCCRCWTSRARSRPPRPPCSILGETGTGKELFARAIHAREPAPRASPGQGELRGDPRGADRERVLRPRARRLHRRDRAGATAGSRWPTAAPSSSTRSASCRSSCRPSCCACSRRASSSRSAARGRARSTCASSRPPTATSRRAVPRGKFREDLYYRLSVFPHHAAAAARARRRRRARWPRTFARQFAPAHGAAGSAADSRPRRRGLRAYAWPGNVRELAERDRAGGHHRARRPAEPRAGAARRQRARAPTRRGRGPGRACLPPRRWPGSSGTTSGARSRPPGGKWRARAGPRACSAWLPPP